MQLKIHILVVSALFSFSCFAVEPSWVEKSNENAQVLLKTRAKHSPEGASQLGVEGFDEEISDFSRDKFDEVVADARADITELKKRLAAETHPKIKQDLEILIGAAEDHLVTLTLGRKHFMPFADITGMIFGVTRQMLDPRISEPRQKTLLVRLEKYAGLSKGFRPITELARDRTLERIKADADLLAPFKGRVEQTLNDGPIFRKGIKDLLLKSDLKGWEQSFKALDKQLTEYNEWLNKEMLPRARDDHRLPAE